MNTALAIVVDAGVVSVVALLVWRALRRKPAALRHMVLAAALAAIAAMPVLETAVPPLDVPVLAGTQMTASGLASNAELNSASVVDVSQTSATPARTWALTLFLLWSVGFVAVMAGLAVGLIRLMLITRRCRPVQANAWQERAAALSREHGLRRSVAVLECPGRSLLMTWGLFRPRIIVPVGARSWTAGRIDVVLAHELAHIVRRDWVVHIASEVVRAVHWFNPLVWMITRRLRDESEQACDDAVLRRGLTPVDYASHLLAVARHVAADGRQWATAPAVADPSTLERRISAMLNDSRNRMALTRTGGAFTLCAAFVLTVPLAAITLTEQADLNPAVPTAVSDVRLVPSVPPAAPAVAIKAPARRSPRAAVVAAAPQEPGSVAGTMRDQSGAVLPGVLLTLTNTGSDTRSSAASDVSGAFIFRNLTPSTYTLTAQLPGFTALKAELTVGNGQNLQTGYLTMPVGSLVESVGVTCASAAAAVSPDSSSILAFERRAATPRLFVTSRTPAVIMTALAAQQVPIRVGGQIKAPRRTKSVQPACPVPPPGVGTVVILESTIGVDGLVKDIKVMKGAEPGFTQAAIDAVGQWEFTPTLLNNVAVPVIMTVTVTFSAK